MESRRTDIIDVESSISRSMGRRVLAAIVSLVLGLTVVKLVAATDAGDQAAKRDQQLGLPQLPADLRVQQQHFPDVRSIIRVFAHRPFGHARHVSSIVFADKDKTLLTATSQGISVWNIDKQELVDEIPVAAMNETLLAMNRDRSLLAVAGDLGDVRILDWPKGESRVLLKPADFGNFRYITKIAMSPDGVYLAFGFRRWGWSNPQSGPNAPNLVTEGGFEIWDIDAQRKILANEEVDGAIIALDWSPDKHVLAVGRIDGLIKFVDVDGKAAGETLNAPNLDSPVAIRFDSSGKRLACVTIGGSVALWRLGAEKPAWSVIGLRSGKKLIWQNSPGDLYFDETRRQVIAKSWDLVVCDLDSGAVKQRKRDLPRLGQGLSVSGDGNKLAMARDGQRVEFFDLRSPSDLFGAEWLSTSTRRAFSPNGEVLAILDNYRIQFIRVSDGRLIAEARHPANSRPLAWSADSTKIAIPSGRQGKSSMVIDLIDARTAKTLQSWSSGSHTVVGLAFSADGRTLVAVDGRKVKIWDVPSEKLTREVTIRFEPSSGSQPGDWAEQVALSPDGRILAVMVRLGTQVHRNPVNESSTSCVEIYEFPNGQHSGTLYCPGQAKALAFSGDSKTLGVAASEFATTVGVSRFPRLILYDVEKVVKTNPSGWIEGTKRVPGGASQRGSSSVSLDAKADHALLACGPTVTFWDCRELEMLREWRFPVDITYATLTPDGKHFLTMNSDGSSYFVAFDPVLPQMEQSKTK